MASYLQYIFNQGSNVLGHYRFASGLQTTTGTVGANSIVFSATYGGPQGQMAAILRVSIGIEITHAVTTAQSFDFNLFSFRGATGVSAGSSSVLGKVNGINMRPNMAPSGWLNNSNGEFRSLGGSLTGITAATGKANSGAPIGTVAFGTLYDTTATGSSVLLSIGGATAPAGQQDLFVLQSGVSHPLVLNPNDGFEIQQITASPSQALSYLVFVEWAEVLNL